MRLARHRVCDHLPVRWAGRTAHSRQIDVAHRIASRPIPRPERRGSEAVRRCPMPSPTRVTTCTSRPTRFRSPSDGSETASRHDRPMRVGCSSKIASHAPRRTVDTDRPIAGPPSPISSTMRCCLALSASSIDASTRRSAKRPRPPPMTNCGLPPPRDACRRLSRRLAMPNDDGNAATSNRAPASMVNADVRVQ